jgi:hypothetical protein
MQLQNTLMGRYEIAKEVPLETFFTKMLTMEQTIGNAHLRRYFQWVKLTFGML